MRHWLKRIGIALVVLFLAAQVYRPARTNPPVDAAKTIYADAQVAEGIPDVLMRACMDCHSNGTAWPWYSQVAPVSWLLVDDVNKGRKDMNFSEWAGYPPKKKAERLDKICDEITEGAMPLPIYTLMHADAKLTPEEVKAVCAWTKTAGERLAGAPGETKTGEREEKH